MSFEKLQDQSSKPVHERSCILLNHFTPNELKNIKNIGALLGIRDQQIIQPTQAQEVIKNLLDQQLENPQETGEKEEKGEVPPYKMILFNNISYQRMNAFIEALKKYRMTRPLIAVVTEHSINWTVEELVRNLVEERIAIQNQKGTAH